VRVRACTCKMQKFYMLHCLVTEGPQTVEFTLILLEVSLDSLISWPAKKPFASKEPAVSLTYYYRTESSRNLMQLS